MRIYELRDFTALRRKGAKELMEPQRQLESSQMDQSRILHSRRFYGIPGDERSTWRAFLLKLGAENLEDTADEEELVAAHR